MKLYVTIIALTRLTETQACIEALSRMDDVDNCFFNILYGDNCPSEWAINEEQFRSQILPLAKFPNMQIKKVDGNCLPHQNHKEELIYYANNINGYDLYQSLESDILMNPDWKHYADKLHKDLSPRYKLGFTSPLNIRGATWKMYRKHPLEEGYCAQKFISANTFIVNNEVCKLMASLSARYWECGWESRMCKELSKSGYIHVCTAHSHGFHIGTGGLSYSMKRWITNAQYDDFEPDKKIQDIYTRLNLPEVSKRR